MPTYLLKTEPRTFSYADLVREKESTWDGVSNPAALINIRAMRTGDDALIYHTGDERAIVGVARVTSNPYQDPSQPGLNKDGLPKFAVVDLSPRGAAKSPLTLHAMKADPRFAGFDLLRLPRLSVVPVPAAIDRVIRALTGL